MKPEKLARELVATLPAGLPNLFNPYRDICAQETRPDGPRERLDRLVRHLDCQPRVILVGEAVGYQGGRYSGIAFTSERLLLEGAIPRQLTLTHRLSHRPTPFSEPSATIVWKTLYRLGIEAQTILWNAVQLHPSRPGEPWSNRTPTPAELALGAPALRLLLKAFPEAMVIAVGNKAKEALAALNIDVPVVRHPANGGATLFAQGMEQLLGRQ